MSISICMGIRIGIHLGMDMDTGWPLAWPGPSACPWLPFGLALGVRPSLPHQRTNGAQMQAHWR